MQFNLVNNKEMMVSCAPGSMMERFAQRLAIGHVVSLQWLLKPCWENHCAAFFFFFRWLLLSLSAFLIFLLPFHFPPPNFFLFPLLSQCDDRRPCTYVGAHGWVAVMIANHGSILLSRGWLITVEAPGHPGHPPSTQPDAIINNNNKLELET